MKKSLVLIVLLCVFNCKTNIEKTNNENVETKTMESKLVAKGNLYGSGKEGIDEQNMVITNQNDWDELITQMNLVNNVSDGFSETVIDFSQHTIIAVFDKVKGSGGHHLELAIISNPKNTIVNITHVTPKGNATSVMTQPYLILKIAKQNLPIKFLNTL
jgi:hypothetical protein